MQQPAAETPFQDFFSPHFLFGPFLRVLGTPVRLKICLLKETGSADIFFFKSWLLFLAHRSWQILFGKYSRSANLTKVFFRLIKIKFLLSSSIFVRSGVAAASPSPSSPSSLQFRDFRLLPPSSPVRDKPVLSPTKPFFYIFVFSPGCLFGEVFAIHHPSHTKPESPHKKKRRKRRKKFWYYWFPLIRTGMQKRRLEKRTCSETPPKNLGRQIKKFCSKHL